MHNTAFAHKVSMFANLIAYYQEQNQWAASFTPVSQGTFYLYFIVLVLNLVSF